MQRMDPSFDYRTEGFSTFTKFLVKNLANIADMKVVRPKGPGDVIVQLIDKPQPKPKPDNPVKEPEAQSCEKADCAVADKNH